MLVSSSLTVVTSVMFQKLVRHSEHGFPVRRQSHCAVVTRYLAHVRSVRGGTGTLCTQMHVTVYLYFTVRVAHPLLRGLRAKPSWNSLSSPRAVFTWGAVLTFGRCPFVG